ncbi:MAG: hypothetical protein JNK30_04535 [Phenylobacterium sp.]|uniref:hypothetical protein n=1 Tax=Phenylobacterium sp. TaxID=1871053 RepID=UPI001A4E8819|nr:hypothetical protein [Phenylobacterium sp.]MBL8770627.1 hypothetical protein [Phenylobacterium sp.]
MGFSGSWAAVQGAPRDGVLAALGLEPSGQSDAFPDFRVCLGELPGGWLLLWYDRDLSTAFEAARDLSPLGPALACAIEEHVMFQEARGYADGAEVWRVTHDPNRGGSLYHLETDGAPPPELAGIHADLKAQQDAEGGETAGVDLICDVPLELARSICGFKHDLDPPDGVVFEELRQAKRATGTSRPGFFARLFGAR